MNQFDWTLLAGTLLLLFASWDLRATGPLLTVAILQVVRMLLQVGGDPVEVVVGIGLVPLTAAVAVTLGSLLSQPGGWSRERPALLMRLLGAMAMVLAARWVPVDNFVDFLPQALQQPWLLRSTIMLTLSGFLFTGLSDSPADFGLGGVLVLLTLNLVVFVTYSQTVPLIFLVNGAELLAVLVFALQATRARPAPVPASLP
ncbi:MAG: hypothetical protein OXG36_04245 [Caldilineaceae bacterium]|nr:hypothetical protein [Caldilineaceae bacterium]